MINLREGEEIKAVKRRHFIVFLSQIFMLVIFFLVSIIGALIVFFVPFSLPTIATETFPALLGIEIRFFALYFISILLILIWQMGFVIFANYYLDCWIITSERTIHTELKSIFFRKLSTVPHTKIQDITVNVIGILPTILKYGDLQIQTAGTFREFIFKQIPDPYKTKELIFEAQKEYFEKRNRPGRETEGPVIETDL